METNKIEVGQKIQVLKDHTFTEKGKLILSRKLLNEIDWLHKNVTSGIEWCGILFYKVVEGEIYNPSSLVLRAEQLYLMDIGSAAYTEADITSDDIFNMMDFIPNYEGMKRAMIHSHHSMKAFFSSTDQKELHDNAPLHDFYLSLIVNYSGEYCAKVAFVSEREVDSKFSYKDSFNQTRTIERKYTEKLLSQIEMTIVKETEEITVDEHVVNKFNQIKADKEAARLQSINSYNVKNGYGTQGALGGYYGKTLYGEGFKYYNEYEQKDKQSSRELINTVNSKFSSKSKLDGPVSNSIKAWLTYGVEELLEGAVLGSESIEDILSYMNEICIDRIKDESSYDVFLTNMGSNIDKFFEFKPSFISNYIFNFFTDNYYDPTDTHSNLVVELGDLLSSYSKLVQINTGEGILQKVSKKITSSLKTTKSKSNGSKR